MKNKKWTFTKTDMIFNCDLCKDKNIPGKIMLINNVPGCVCTNCQNNVASLT